MNTNSNQPKTRSTFLSSRQGRKIKEAISAYLMVFPALLLIFVFGLFPVLFAVYVSFHRWKIKQGDFIGLANYTKAIDNLAYILFFAAAIGLLYFAWRGLAALRQTLTPQDKKTWLLSLPAAVHAASGLLFIRWFTFLLPEFLGIADIVQKTRSEERTRAFFAELFRNALNAEKVAPALRAWVTAFAAAWVITIIIWRWYHHPQRNDHLSRLVSIWLFLSGGVITAIYTYSQMQLAVAASIETGEEVNIWVQVVTISAGILLLLAAWRLWNSGVKAVSDRELLLKGTAALFLLVGAWLLIGELPAAIQAGDEDVWLGLKVTAFYSFGTIPFQLLISLVLAFLLFQNIRGKEFFRVLFFLPYITPAVASAAVFKVIFSPRPSAIMNAALGGLGIEPQKWLLEARGVFTILAEAWGFENFPDWAGGPSQALAVVIIYSIWVYVGYDVVIFLAGLGNISNEINEAAEIDGANKWQILRHITLPLLSPTIYFLSLIAVIGTFKAFNHVYIMRDALALGTMDTFSVAIFDTFFSKNRFGYATSMAFVLFAVILSLTYINNKIQGSRVFYG